MQLYRFTNQFPNEGFDPEIHKQQFAGSRADAKKLIDRVVQTDRVNHFVELVDISTSKDNVLRMLASEPVVTVLKRWKFTGRGALRECDDQGRFLEPDKP